MRDAPRRVVDTSQQDADDYPLRAAQVVVIDDEALVRNATVSCWSNGAAT